MENLGKWPGDMEVSLGTEHLPGALCSGTGSPALGCPPPGDLPDPGIEPMSLMSPAN